MGREARCRVRHGGVEAEAAAQLETDEVIVRSPFRLKVPRSSIRGAAAAGDVLTIDCDGGPLELDLGEREAARWAHDLANPKTLADKLGVKPGQRVRLVGTVDEQLVGRGRRVTRGTPDVVFLAARRASDLDRIPAIRDRIARDGSIWVIRPKGEPDITEAMVIGAGRAAGMHDVKIARISETHTGMKFVIPVERR
ncbi:MAG TPA: hypothetical protein VGC71_14650 [Gaiellales bacterium]|jgi:hypothetical protein